MNKKKRDVFGWFKRLWREQRPRVIAAIVLLVGLPVVLFLALPGDEGSPVVDKALGQARADTESGDYAGAYDKLRALDGQAISGAQKVELYANLAAAAANASKPLDAIDYLLAKHQIDPGSAGRDAYMLASLYEETGDTAKALLQYGAALDYYKSLPKDESNDARIESIQAIIANLEAADG